MHHKNINEVFLQTGYKEGGLSDAEAAVRLAKNGANKLVEKQRKPAILRFLAQFKDTMVLVLIAAAFISAGLSLAAGEDGAFTDTIIIMVIVVLNAIIGFVQQSKAEKALESLKKLSAAHSNVLRSGEIKRVSSESLVVGDVVILEAGDSVPADLRLIEANSLKIAESALTGESDACTKNTLAVAQSSALGDRTCMAFSSGAVVYGRGRGVVVATAMNTEIGRVARLLEQKQPPTPMQKKLDKTGRFISVAVIIIAAVIFVAGLFSTMGFAGKSAVTESLMRSIAIAVAAIPEGLPAVTTIIMAFGVQTLSRRKAIIKNLPAVETLGCTQVICSDKTGTLTQNKMTVTALYLAGDSAFADVDERTKIHGNSGFYSSFGVSKQRDLAALTDCMALCNNAVLTQTDGKRTALGDPTEAALTEFLAANPPPKNGSFAENSRRTHENPFDSVRKRMSVVVKGKNGQEKVFAKGAVDELLSVCTHVLSDGEVRPLNAQDRTQILTANHKMAARALRVLGFASKPLNHPDQSNNKQNPLNSAVSQTSSTKNQDKNSANHEKNLVFIGLAGMIDPPRPEAASAVATCKKAGMRAVMITGDHKDTAAAIATTLGILDPNPKIAQAQIITGKQLDELSDKQFQKLIKNITVYARVSPENKVRIVKAWQKRGKVVAMTGDGVNDAPSLKAADIGIGMGQSGTDIAKSVADMVLTDDNFATIIVAVREGRKVYANIEKAMQFLLSANIAEVLSLFIVTVFFRGVSFLLPVHLLWINLVTDSLPALALGTERAEKDIMDYPPRRSDRNMFRGRLGANIVYQGILQTAIVLFVFFFAKLNYGERTAMTMALVSLCFIQLFHAFNARSQRHSIFTVGVFSNFLLLVAFVLGAGLTYLIVEVPQLSAVFGTVALTLDQWVLAISVSFAIVPLVEIIKILTPSGKSRPSKNLTNPARN